MAGFPKDAEPWLSGHGLDLLAERNKPAAFKNLLGLFASHGVLTNALRLVTAVPLK